MTQTTILLFTLGMLAGLPAGYALGWLVDVVCGEIRSILAVYAMFCCLDRITTDLDALTLHIYDRTPA